MIDHTAIAAGNSLRAEIAAKMAAYEAKHGPVETKPIITRTSPAIVYDNARAADMARSRAKGARKGGAAMAAERVTSPCGDWQKARRQRNIDTIKPLLIQGMSTAAIAEVVGLSPRSVNRIVAELRA